MSGLIRDARKYPATAVCILVSALLYTVVGRIQFTTGMSFTNALAAYGAVTPFDLWNGQWWRIFVSTFHHGGLVHLTMNLVTVAFLGTMLERRLGTLRYTIFVLAAAAVTGLAESFFNDSWVGISGVACAMFGLLVVLRQTDDQIAEFLPRDVVLAGVVILFAGIPLSYFEVLPIANVAHFTGAAYGLLTGQLCYGMKSLPRLSRAAFVFAHLLLVPAFYLVMHPVWNGRYQWRLADLARNTRQEDEAIRRYRLAVELDPQLEGAWRNLAYLYQIRREPFESWKSIVHGLYFNPFYKKQEGVNFARLMWVQMSADERQEAQRFLQDLFGDKTPQWERLVAVDWFGNPRVVTRPADELEEAEPAPESGPPRLPIRAIDEAPHGPVRLPAPNGDLPGSAEEGQQTSAERERFLPSA